MWPSRHSFSILVIAGIALSSVCVSGQVVAIGDEDSPTHSNLMSSLYVMSPIDIFPYPDLKLLGPNLVTPYGNLTLHPRYVWFEKLTMGDSWIQGGFEGDGPQELLWVRYKSMIKMAVRKFVLVLPPGVMAVDFYVAPLDYGNASVTIQGVDGTQISQFVPGSADDVSGRYYGFYNPSGEDLGNLTFHSNGTAIGRIRLGTTVVATVHGDPHVQLLGSNVMVTYVECGDYTLLKAKPPMKTKQCKETTSTAPALHSGAASGAVVAHERGLERELEHEDGHSDEEDGPLLIGRYCMRDSAGQGSSTCGLALRCSAKDVAVEVYALKAEVLTVVGGRRAQLNYVGASDSFIERTQTGFIMRCEGRLKVNVHIRESSSALYFDISTQMYPSMFDRVHGLLGTYSSTPAIVYRSGQEWNPGHGMDYLSAVEHPTLAEVQASWAVQGDEMIFSLSETDSQAVCNQIGSHARRSLLSEQLKSDRASEGLRLCEAKGLKGNMLRACAFDYVATADISFVENAFLANRHRKSTSS